jgi:hypothetical protein
VFDYSRQDTPSSRFPVRLLRQSGWSETVFRRRYEGSELIAVFEVSRF